MDNSHNPGMGLGERIATRRVATGMSQAELARRCGISREAVAQWESGATQPATKRLIDIAEALRVEVTWLIGGTQDPNIEIRRRVQSAREMLGLSQLDIDEILDQNPGYTQDLETGARAIYDTLLRRIAGRLHLRLEWLIDGTGPAVDPVEFPGGPPTRQELLRQALERKEMVSQALDYRAVPATASMPRDVAILGVTVGDDNVDFCLNGNVIDHVRRPPGLAGASNVFAIYVIGDSMYPRFEEGDLVYIQTGRPPKSGDDVVVELRGDAGKPGNCYIRRLVRRTSNDIQLSQFTPPIDDIRIPTDRIREIYRIARVSELLGA